MTDDARDKPAAAFGVVCVRVNALQEAVIFAEAVPTVTFESRAFCAWEMGKVEGKDRRCYGASSAIFFFFFAAQSTRL